MNREQWLTELAARMAPRFAELGSELPKVRLTLSLLPARVVGRCYSPTASADETSEIMVRIDRTDPLEIAGVVAHELTHAAVGIPAGHQGPFRALATALGLEGKMTATVPGPAFAAWIAPVLAELGPLPHGGLDLLEGGTTRKKQGTRMIKMTCDECGYVARTTRKWLEEVGPPLCACNSEPMAVA